MTEPVPESALLEGDRYDSSDEEEQGGGVSVEATSKEIEPANSQDNVGRSSKRFKRVVDDDEEDDGNSSDSEGGNVVTAESAVSGAPSPTGTKPSVEAEDNDSDEYDPEQSNVKAKKKPVLAQKHSKPESSNTPKDAKSDKKETEFDRLIKAGKPIRRKEPTAEEKQREVEGTLDIMRHAYTLDRQLRKRGEPALEKLSKLDKVVSSLSKQVLQHSFVENGAGDCLVDWLRPGKNQIPNERLRTKLFRVIERLPFPEHEELMTKCQIGKIIRFYLCHGEETSENKRLLENIISKWIEIMKKNAD